MGLLPTVDHTTNIFSVFVDSDLDPDSKIWDSKMSGPDSRKKNYSIGRTTSKPHEMILIHRTFKLWKWNVSPVKKLFDTQCSFQATWNWITEHSNYENEMYLLWTNFYIFNKVSKPHDSGSQNIHAMEMKCTSCEKTFRYVLNEASKPHETECGNSLFYFL